jgi:hypothetical protein
MDATEARIRALQRIAYGADATDVERARAVAELVELGVQAARAAGPDGFQSAVAADEGTGATTSANAADVADGTHGQASVDREPKDDVTTRGSLVRWTIVAGGVGLLLGAALSWAAGQLIPEDSIFPSMVGPTSSADPATPLERTDLLPLFDRLPLAAESTRVSEVDPTIDPASVRLLATRSDGPSGYLTRTLDGQNVCLVLMLPAGPSSLACTIDGLLPAEGLMIQYYARGYGLAVARLAASGTVTLGLLVTF